MKLKYPFTILEPGTPEWHRFIARQRFAMPSQIRASREAQKRRLAEAGQPPDGDPAPEAPEPPEPGSGQ